MENEEKVKCPKCGSKDLKSNSHPNRIIWTCKICNRHFSTNEIAKDNGKN